MVIDIIICIFLLLAIIKGWKKGIIHAFFSFISLFVGLLLATKLSAITANYLGQTTSINKQWLPVAGFFVVLILVIIALKLCAGVINKLAQTLMLGLPTRIAGVAFYVAIYLIAVTVILFYLNKWPVVPDRLFEKSIIYPRIKNLGPKVIELFGNLAPWFKNIFSDLSAFFDNNLPQNH